MTSRGALGPLAAVVAAILSSGCMSFSTLGRARTLPEGSWEVWAAPEAYVVAHEDGASVRPTARAGVRYGLARDVEIDVDVGPLSVAVSTRIQLVRGTGRGVDLALQPMLSWAGPDKGAVAVVALLGVNFDAHQLVIAPRLAYQMRVGVGGEPVPVSFLYAGASVGLALRIDRVVTLLPELSALTQVHADPGYASNLASAVGLTGAFGVLFELR